MTSNEKLENKWEKQCSRKEKFKNQKHKNILVKEDYISKKWMMDGTIATTTFLMCNVMRIL
jgi:hypothetical protein